MIDYFKMAVTEKYAQFHGRSTRSEYWYFALTYFLIILVVGMIAGFTAFIAVDSGGPSLLVWIFGGLFVLIMLALIIPSISVSIRRLHDSGKSGWWYMVNFVPYVGGLIFIVLMCLDSEPGTNQYGPNPFELDSGDDISGHLVKEDLV